jgi:hypothetical protein
LVEGLEDRERRRAQVRDQLAALEHCERVSQFDPASIERDLRTRLEDWRGLLCLQLVQARQILRKLVGRLVFTPRKDANRGYYEFSGQGTMTRILEGIVLPKGGAAPGGISPNIYPSNPCGILG